MYLTLRDVQWTQIEPLFRDRTPRPGLRPQQRAADVNDTP